MYKCSILSHGLAGIFGGFLLGVRSVSGLSLYDWDTLELVRRIEIQPKHVYWSESGELVALATEDSYFVLRYDAAAVQAAREQGGDSVTQDGVEEAFDVSLCNLLLNLLSCFDADTK